MGKKKGFTLIELLGVIVILALLVLIAVPAITRIMTSATKNSFKNEVNGMVSDLEKAFTEKMSKEVISTGSNQGCSSTNVYNITASDGRGYAYLCMTLSDMVNEQFIKKNLGQSYGGYIQMWVPDGSGATITFVNVTNGRYFIQGRMTEVSKSDFTASQTAYGGSEVSKPTQATPCPSTCGTIPADSVTNLQDNGNNNNNNNNNNNDNNNTNNNNQNNNNNDNTQTNNNNQLNNTNSTN